MAPFFIMEINSKLILASKSSTTGVVLYTFVLQYPRIILSEVNTHRMLSRNTASSRAIPSRKQREKVLLDPFLPVTIGKNQKGMQAGEELRGWRKYLADKTWALSRYPAVWASWVLEKLGAHKQVVNRLVEPWTFTEQIVSATDLKNVFQLRNHPDAEPHFHILAAQMQKQVQYVDRVFDTITWNAKSWQGRQLPIDHVYEGIGTIQMLHPGEWHMPFVESKDVKQCMITKFDVNDKIYTVPDWDALKQVSTARCGRVSYALPDTGERSYLEKDLGLCKRLSQSGHWSPFEHVATPSLQNQYIGNFNSWLQYRKQFPLEGGGDR